jgi:hypothetical protein
MYIASSQVKYTNNSESQRTPAFTWKKFHLKVFINCTNNIVFLTLKEEHKYREFEKRLPTRIFEPKRKEITRGWINFHNEGKVKVVHHAMKACWEWRYSSTHSLTSALDIGEWSVSRPGRFTPRERSPDTHWIGCWVGPEPVWTRR